MTTLPTNPFTLKGSCFCGAITYTLSIPPASQRPSITRHSTPNQTFPYICLDHCNSCRHTAGAIVQCWLEVPQSWSTFKLQLRGAPTASGPPEAVQFEDLEAKDFVDPSAETMERTFLGCFKSSPEVRRTFCARCATHLTFFDLPREKEAKEEEGGVTMDMTLGSLVEESLKVEGLRAAEGWRGIFAEEGLGWFVEGMVGK